MTRRKYVLPALLALVALALSVVTLRAWLARRPAPPHFDAAEIAYVELRSYERTDTAEVPTAWGKYGTQYHEPEDVARLCELINTLYLWEIPSRERDDPAWRVYAMQELYDQCLIFHRKDGGAQYLNFGIGTWLTEYNGRWYYAVTDTQRTPPTDHAVRVYQGLSRALYALEREGSPAHVKLEEAQ